MSGQATWVAPLPAPIQMAWWRRGSDCRPLDLSCAELSPFAISAMSCDNCDLVLPGSAGFTPVTPDDLSTVRDAPFVVYAMPRVLGPISFTAELASTAGVNQTVTYAGTGDRVTALTATCMQTRGSDGQTAPCGATRASTDTIALAVSVTTAGRGEQRLTDLLGDIATAGGNLLVMESALPTMSPDAATWDWGNASLPATTTATAETLRWTVGAATLTATVAIPPVAN